MIIARKLTRRFGRMTAVSNVSFEVGRGEIVGFIGPNGAGKTTTMRMLTGFLPATEGSCEVAGFDVFDDPMKVRQRVGYLPETPPLYPELTVGRYLQFVAEIRQVPRSARVGKIGEVMERVGLSGWEDRILSSLSKGYRQRVGLAQSIIHDPEVLILDEPTSGLDPRQVVGIRSFIRGLAEDRTVILSTHILSEVEELCERVLLIDGGELIAADTLAGLKAGVGGGVRYRVELSDPAGDPAAIPAAVGALEIVDLVEPQDPDGAFAVMDIRSAADPRTEIARLATENSWLVRTMERRQPSLEEAFLAAVGEER
jgi:ABC-2 type transport system ATP-binding protein